MNFSTGIQIPAQAPSMFLMNANYTNPSNQQQSVYFNNGNPVQIVGTPYPVVYNFIPQISVQPVLANTGSLNQVQSNQGTFFMQTPFLQGQQVIQTVNGFINNIIQTKQEPLLLTNTGQTGAVTNGPTCQPLSVLPQTSTDPSVSNSQSINQTNISQPNGTSCSFAFQVNQNPISASSQASAAQVLNNSGSINEANNAQIKGTTCVSVLSQTPTASTSTNSVNQTNITQNEGILSSEPAFQIHQNSLSVLSQSYTASASINSGSVNQANISQSAQSTSFTPACQVQVNSVPVLSQTSTVSVPSNCDSNNEIASDKTLCDNKPNSEILQPKSPCEKTADNIQQPKKFKPSMPGQKCRPFRSFKLVLDNDTEPVVSSSLCKARPLEESENEDSSPGGSTQEKENETQRADSEDFNEQSRESLSTCGNDTNDSEDLKSAGNNNSNDFDDEQLKDDENIRVKFKEKDLMQNTQKGKKSKCNLCGNYVVKLDLHFERYHGTPSKCKYCGKMFEDMWQTKKHMQKEHLEQLKKEFTCNICQKTFSEKQDLRNHKFAAHGSKRKFTCEECGRNFNHLSTLESHRKVHTGVDRSYVCEICGKRFPTRNTLRHARMHSQTRECKCPYCDKSFNEKDQLQKHLRLHTGEKPYKCRHCPKAFNHNVSLKAHVKKYHPDVGLNKESDSMDAIVIE
ncbi:zinc finger and BTB domain-containing protein 17-like isoform X2 [Saccostrea cucullata]|uniref:zinc finger and BTB domain-containing protein 17-like isoform X2 n=1 Tax=Saccostrea cuccullata TaxID=36930 RepID=UPI002ED40B44